MTERSSLNLLDATQHTLMEECSQPSSEDKQSLRGKGWLYLELLFSIVASVICMPSTGLENECQVHCLQFKVGSGFRVPRISLWTDLKQQSQSFTETRAHFLSLLGVNSDYAQPITGHVGIANPWWRGKHSRHSRRMRILQFYVSGKRSIALFYLDVITGPFPTPEVSKANCYCSSIANARELRVSCTNPSIL